MVNLFLKLLAIRLVNSLTMATFFQADEYWQALEPAHWWVFGYGGLTWEWELGLRSALHPLIYTVPYYIVQALGLDYNWIIIAPKIVNGVIAAIGEYYLYHLTLVKTKDKQLAKWVLALSLFSVWNWMCWTRSFANSLELSFTIVSLYWLERGLVNKCLCLAAVTCVIRPTNAIIWIVEFLPRVFRKPTLMVNAMVIGMIVLSLDSIVNYTFYGRLVSPILTFFKFNATSNLSAFYGVSRLDFYFDQGIPILLLHYVPFFIYGVWLAGWFNFDNWLILIYLLAFTCIQHKEFRFIYPLMPFMLQKTARGVIAFKSKVNQILFNILKLIAIVIFIVLSYYLTRVHESAEYEMPSLIRSHVLDSYTDHPVSVGFLTPCHSTPFQSHIHLPQDVVDIWYLTCLPPLDSPLEGYKDESDYFYEDPLLFLQNNFPKRLTLKRDCPGFRHCWPEYIVMFEILWNDNEVQSFLNNSYEVLEARDNTLVHWDDRREGQMLLLKHI